MPVYQTSPHEPVTETGVVAVHCSDPRYQPHFQDFLRNSLGIANYAVIAVPGGPQFLARMDLVPKFSWVGWRWLKFVVDLTRTQRLVLITHDDCRWYFSLLFGADHERIRKRQIADLRAVHDEFAERFKIPQVEAYHATLEGNQATFESI